ncbi:DNA polymerase III subunit gamma and tau [Actinopolymorpha sp. B9G3]|uniref:DNA polymerase III subunit gamma and tau n=1 Tax=Actinopolymorpha sp. B9G3 TaxID=3158970 RepID=UPI0032D98998
MEAPLALYRRYRPETYAEVIGQSHVTEPLQQALRNNRVHHAYLFSGPRGCGKTTSARILARCLNCEKGPTPEPCGTCQSCLDLARGGPGSIDVIEIDAASHGGVDDARDLRERAFFAPVAARHKIYIVDEAHMVTTQGFNALLKLVEEPPDHLKFIFATTEPDKVIGTIRSRTHHYPFRLVPPKLLQDYLAGLCTREGVTVDPGALPLVVRAGGGSVRDTLSVLDQLMGGAGEDGVTYARAVALLGYTHEALLDEVVDAFAAGDGAGVFAVIDKVIESGQDPRRFAEDLLRRLRDLVVVSAIPDAAARGLLEGPPDQAERLTGQAARFGAADLSRAADVLNAGLTEMRGATAPRLHLELICARMLLPAADHSEQGIYARLDRIERRMSIMGTSGQASAPDAPSGAPASSSRERSAQDQRSRGVDRHSRQVQDRGGDHPAEASPGDTDRHGSDPRAAGQRAEEQGSEPARASGNQSVPVDTGVSAADAGRSAAPAAEARPVSPSPVKAVDPASAGGSSGSSGMSLADVRRLWPDVLETVKNARRFAWVMLSQNAQVTGLHNDVLTIGLINSGARDSFARSGSDEVLRNALREVLGVDWRVEPVIDPSAGGSGSSGTGGGPTAAGPTGGGPTGGGRPTGGGGTDGGGQGGDAPGDDSGWSGSGSDWGGSLGGGSARGRAASGGTPSGSAAVDGGARGADEASSAGGSGGGPTGRGGRPGGSDGGVGGSGAPRSVPAADPEQRRAHTHEAAGGTHSELLGGASAPRGGARTQTSARAGGADSGRGENTGGSASSGRPGRGRRGVASQGQPADEPPHDPDGDVDPDTDGTVSDSPASQTELLVREFGAEVIEELPAT